MNHSNSEIAAAVTTTRRTESIPAGNVSRNLVHAADSPPSNSDGGRGNGLGRGGIAAIVTERSVTLPGGRADSRTECRQCRGIGLAGAPSRQVSTREHDQYAYSTSAWRRRDKRGI